MKKEKKTQNTESNKKQRSLVHSCSHCCVLSIGQLGFRGLIACDTQAIHHLKVDLATVASLLNQRLKCLWLVPSCPIDMNESVVICVVLQNLQAKSFMNIVNWPIEDDAYIGCPFFLTLLLGNLGEVCGSVFTSASIREFDCRSMSTDNPIEWIVNLLKVM
jgi:hypothetical protein